MMTKQWIWAMAFGAMLAITGCGDDDDSGTGGTGNTGTGGTGNTGNSSGSGFCDIVCTTCGDLPQNEEAECVEVCEQQLDEVVGFDLDSCPNELDTLLDCVERTNDCSFESCTNEYTDWLFCVASINF